MKDKFNKFLSDNLFDVLIFVYCFMCGAFFAATDNVEGMLIMGYLTFMWLIITGMYRMSVVVNEIIDKHNTNNKKDEDTSHDQ